MSTLERNLRALRIAVYAFVIAEGTWIAIQFAKLVAADIITSFSGLK